jgi:hypothetical protein
MDGTTVHEPPELPDYLTHYYREIPFQSLTELESSDAARVLLDLGAVRELPFRLTHPLYLVRRREIEATMRSRFIEKGGAPQLEHPMYLILGRSALWEQMEPHSVEVSLATIPDEVLSFTFTDSFFAFSSHNLHGAAIPPQPFHGDVYLRTELPALVVAFGLPGIAPNDNLHPVFDPYIEAQLWCPPASIGIE